MKLKTVPMAKIRPYERNPRKNDGAVDAVAESIRQCGYVAPIIVDEDFIILAGHTRHKALQKLGHATARVLIAEGLTEEQKRKYRLLDNRTNELAEWDTDLLALELDGLDFGGFDFGLLDFKTDGGAEAKTEAVEDEFNGEPPAEPVTKRGQVWQLGRHRIMCGDSTSAEDVQTLMGGYWRTWCSPTLPMGWRSATRTKRLTRSRKRSAASRTSRATRSAKMSCTRR